jgi:hypothetical protein
MLRKTLKVGAYRYKVTSSRTPLLVNNRECYGVHDAEELTISYCTTPTQHPTHLKSVLWHETVHAICHDRHIEMNEDDTERLAAGLNALMVDNGVEFWELPNKPKKAKAK